MERDRIVILRNSHSLFIEDLQYLTGECVFLYDRERELENSLLTGFTEMRYMMKEYEKHYKQHLIEGMEDIEQHFEELNTIESSIKSDVVIEIYSVALSTTLKSFLLLAKGVLDKLVPLFAYRFNETLRQFDDKGEKLIKLIKDNSKFPQAAKFTMLLKHHKQLWIDDLVELRNDVAHYTALPEYVNFWIPSEWVGTKQIKSIEDFNRPVIRIRGNQHDALEYVLFIVDNMKEFIRDFLRLCDFNDARRPKVSLRCTNCNYEIARKVKHGPTKGKIHLLIPELTIEIRDRVRDYGRIPCPKCHARIDTDLNFWKEQGLIV